jgi:beta-galactosidase
MDQHAEHDVTGAPAPAGPTRRHLLTVGATAVALWGVPRAALAAGSSAEGRPEPGPRPGHGRVLESLNGTWDFLPADGTPAYPPADSGWATIPVPAEWNMTSGSFNTSWGAYDLFKTPADWDKLDVAWYRRTVTVPAGEKGRRIVARFEAVNFESTVFWNGTQVAHNLDGLLPFEADVTDAVEWGGTNTIHVLVRSPNAAARQSDGFHFPAGSWWGQTCAGIWQDVWLLSRPPVHVDDTAVVTSVRNGEIKVTTQVANAGQQASPAWVEHVVSDGHRTVLRAEQQTNVAAGGSAAVEFAKQWHAPRLWSPDDPHLYTLTVNVRSAQNGPVTDTATTRFGFREVWVDGATIYLNGDPTPLRGDSWHYMGSIENSRAYATLWFQMAKDAGVNYIRLHAMPYPPVFYDVADEMGMLLIGESGIYGSSGNYALGADDFWANCATHLTRRIRRDRNHPSVIAWSAENEMLAAFGQSWAAKVAAFKPVITALDTSRPVYFEGDGDPEGAGDLRSTHYPLEITTGNTAIPESAYAFAPGGSRAGDWDHKKPFLFGEFSSMYYANPAEVSAIGGPDTYADLDGLWRAHATTLRAQIEGFRYAGITGISPWNIVWYGMKPLPFDPARESLPPHGTEGPKPVQVGRYAATLNPGFEKDLPRWQANAIHDAAARVMQPTAALARDYRAHFWAGSPVTKNLAVYHVSPKGATVTVSWSLRAGGKESRGSAKVAVPAGGGPVDLAAVLTAPKVSRTTSGTWRVTVSADGRQKYTDSADVTVYPASVAQSRTRRKVSAAVLETGGTATSAALARLGVTVRSIADLATLPGTDELLVIGESATVSATADQLSAVTKFVEGGGRVLVLAQQTMPPLLPWPTTVAASAQTVAHVAAPHHAVLTDVSRDDLRWWQTTGETVVSHVIVKPRFGSLTSLADVGSGLALSALAEATYGEGTYLLCQFPIIAASANEPVAAVLLRNIVDYLGGRTATTPGRVGVIAASDKGPVTTTLGAAQVASAPVTTVDAAALADLDIAVVDAAPGNESSLSGVAAAAGAVRDWVKQGGTLWVNGLQPATLTLLKDVLPPDLTLSPVDAAHGQGAVVTGASPLTGGLNNADLDWPGAAQALLRYTVKGHGGTEAVRSRAVDWAAFAKGAEQNKYGVAAESARGFVPDGAVWTATLGKGRIVIDQLGWPAALPLPNQTGIAATLAAGLGAGFSAGSGSGLIPTTDWKPFTNPGSGGATNAYDRNPTTRWSSDALQQPGMFYGLDLGTAYSLTRVIWDSSLSPSDCPRGLDVQVSDDNDTYKTVVSIADTSSSIAGGVLTVNLSSVSARYIKFVDTKSAPGNYLSVHELYLYGTSDTE